MHLQATFEKLKPLLVEAAALLNAEEESERMSLNSAVPGPNGAPMYFGGVEVRKRYVSYYLMPVYMHPELLDAVSPELKKRMQGKSCFNFTQVDEAMLSDLEELTRRSLAAFRADGYMPAQ